MNRFCLFLLLITLTNCSSADKNSTTNDISTRDQNVQDIKPDNKSSVKEVISKDKLLGAWTDGSTENATFDIGKDSIFYVEQLEAFPYTLKGDSITIVYPDMSFEGIVFMVGDTLVLSDSEFGTSKFTRFKN